MLNYHSNQSIIKTLFEYLNYYLSYDVCACFCLSFCKKKIFRPKWIKFANSVNRHLEFQNSSPKEGLEGQLWMIFNRTFLKPDYFYPSDLIFLTYLKYVGWQPMGCGFQQVQGCAVVRLTPAANKTQNFEARNQDSNFKYAGWHPECILQALLRIWISGGNRKE